jgi:cysteine desulfurase / selenocysteine lyase
MAYRSDFPLLAANPALHYLDSAASAQKPKVVLDAIRDYYERSYANPHRGAYSLSVDATERYHLARMRIARFLGAADVDSLIFTRGTTEALNLVATSLSRSNIRSNDEIVVTAMEHHSNFVTWQQAALAAGARFRICELTADGNIDLDMLASMLGPRTRVVAFGHVSNALGTVNPVARIAAMVRERCDALIVCDGAQGAPHIRVDFDGLGVDAYAFSGHKMGGPMGLGGLIARRGLLEALPPYQFGGDMIEFVHDQTTTWAPLPHRFEAGTPNSAGAVGLAAAVEYLDAIGMDNVQAHEQKLVALAQKRLEELGYVTIYGPPPAQRSGVISFNVADVHAHDLATILDSTGVCIRSGHHCAQPLMRRLGVSSTARASFYVYNDESDVKALVAGVRQAMTMFAESGAGVA